MTVNGISLLFWTVGQEKIRHFQMLQWALGNRDGLSLLFADNYRLINQLTDKLN